MNGSKLETRWIMQCERVALLHHITFLSRFRIAKNINLVDPSAQLLDALGSETLRTRETL
jgi:hypothetical protein